MATAISQHTVRLGSRRSRLALRQTEQVAEELRHAWPGLQTEIVTYTTQGDRNAHHPLPEIGGKGLFTAEIEAALRQGKVDAAVHSLKDLPTEDSPSLAIGAVLARADARDVLVSRHGLPIEALPGHPRIGTSSLRRAAQILAARPDAQIVPLRGNVDTRLRKAETDVYDAVVLAAAGLLRLGLMDAITEWLPLEVMLPAPGQGALAVQCRADDQSVLELLAAVHHSPTWAAVTAERAFLRRLGGGCRVPVAAYAQVEGDSLTLQGLVASDDGSERVRGSVAGPVAEMTDLGAALADQLLARGAGELLESGRT